MHSNRQRCTVAIALLLGLALAAPSTSFASIAGLPDENAAKAAVACQKQIGKAGEKFVKNKQKKLDKCLGAIFKCIQTKEAAKQPDCIAKAATKCDKDLAKIFTKDEVKLEQDIIKKCAIPGKIGITEVLDANGLGFTNLVTYCDDEFAITLDGVDDVAECIRRDKECTTERLFRLEFPRASELLDSAGVAGGIVSNFTCLMGGMSAGGGFGDTDPKGAGKALDKCAKATKKAGAKFASSKVKSIEKCLNEIFKCAQTKPGDQKCLDKAAAKCNKEFGLGGKIAKAAEKLASSVQKSCGAPKGPDFSDLAGAMGMNLDDVTSVCAQFGVAGLGNLDDYIMCLFREHECFVDDMIAVQYPRIEELLAEVGLQDEVPASFCGPTPTPTVTATPTATVTPTATLTATPTPVGTATPVPGGTCGDSVWNTGEDCDSSGGGRTTCPGAGNGLQDCTGSCTCECPSIVTFEADPNDPSSLLDTGFTGFAHNSKVIGGATVTVALSGGSSGVAGRRDPNCGVMDISGPLPNPASNAGQNPTELCSGDSSISCTADTDCPATQTCDDYFGSRLPLSAGGVSACVTNRFVAPISGTANIETGTSANTVSLTSTVHVGAAVDKPCANCIGDDIANDGVRGGTCDSDDRSGLACDVQGVSPVPAFNGGVPAAAKVNGTSHDCPKSSGDVGVLPIDLSNSTGTESLTVQATGPTCSAAGFGGSTCMCDTCATLAAEPCNADSDCPAAITCGGLRCLGGGAAGTACTTPGVGDLACAGAPCGGLGEPTKPNVCTSTSCTAGACATGPFNGFCGPVETFRGCLAPSDCTFAGDTCGFIAQPCFDDDGIVGGVIAATGTPDVPVNDTSSPTLASAFCVAPVGASAINAASGLPGAARVTLTGAAAGLPSP